MKTKLRALKHFAKIFIIRLLNTFEIKMRRQLNCTTSEAGYEELLAALNPRFRSHLLSMYRVEPQLGTDGQPHPIDEDTKISAAQGMWLYKLCMSDRTKSTLEIGMAYGYSTIFFLAAIAKKQVGHHISIDPLQSSLWHGIGLTHAQELAPTKDSNSSFRLIEERSDRVAVDLARSNSTFDLIFIDGNHRFDDVLVDFYLYAPLTAINGHIVFDDMWMSSIQTVVAFIRANRSDFIEVYTNIPNICVFRKVSEDGRKWSHFKTFNVSCTSS